MVNLNSEILNPIARNVSRAEALKEEVAHILNGLAASKPQEAVKETSSVKVSGPNMRLLIGPSQTFVRSLIAVLFHSEAKSHVGTGAVVEPGRGSSPLP